MSHMQMSKVLIMFGKQLSWVQLSWKKEEEKKKTPTTALLFFNATKKERKSDFWPTNRAEWAMKGWIGDSHRSADDQISFVGSISEPKPWFWQPTCRIYTDMSPLVWGHWIHHIKHPLKNIQEHTSFKLSHSPLSSFTHSISRQHLPSCSPL